MTSPNNEIDRLRTALKMILAEIDHGRAHYKGPCNEKIIRAIQTIAREAISKVARP